MLKLYVFTIAVFSCVFIPAVVYSCITVNETSKDTQSSEIDTSPDKNSASNEIHEKKGRHFSDKEIINALQAAYPDKIKDVVLKNSDWVILVKNKWFYFAGGRLLPEEALDQKSDYDPHPFYTYPESLRTVSDITETEANQIREQAEKRQQSNSQRHPGFYNTIWDIHDRQTSWDMVKTVYFLGRKINVHYRLLEDIIAVEMELKEKATSNPGLKRYLDSISGIAGGSV